MSPRSTTLFAFILVVSALVGHSSSAPFPSSDALSSMASQPVLASTPASAPGEVSSSTNDPTKKSTDPTSHGGVEQSTSVQDTNQFITEPASLMSSLSGGSLDPSDKPQGSDDKSIAKVPDAKNSTSNKPNLSETTQTASPPTTQNDATPATSKADEVTSPKADGRGQEANIQPPEAVHGKRDEDSASPEKKSDAGLAGNPTQLNDALSNSSPTIDRFTASSLPSGQSLDATKPPADQQLVRSDLEGFAPVPKSTDTSGSSTNKEAQIQANPSPAGDKPHDAAASTDKKEQVAPQDPSTLNAQPSPTSGTSTPNTSTAGDSFSNKDTSTQSQV